MGNCEFSDTTKERRNLKNSFEESLEISGKLTIGFDHDAAI